MIAVAGLLTAFWVELALAKAPSLIIDLGYATYQGYYNDTYDLNIWKSIRYAAAPLGKLRWQAPQAPPVNNSQAILAVDQPPICPQSAFGDEDCLYLNIYAAPDASALPVLVWIHGGGYSMFGAAYDPSVIMNTNANEFIVVELQYRLGAFGFLASTDVKKFGQLNVGLLDQRFALKWIQHHIARFGGDPKRVTIGGESSGAGSTMYHALAFGGHDSHLFDNIIAASPYLPPIYRYDDAVPAKHFDTLASLVGCGRDAEERARYPGTFECLAAADTLLLQNASGIVSTTEGYFSSFAFLPVIDGDYIQDRPLVLLSRGQVNGRSLLVGKNANDGVPLANSNVTSRDAYDDFVSNTFPLFNPQDIKRLNAIYHVDFAQPGDSGIRFDTLGTTRPTALTQSEMATGIQQTVFDISAEAVFDCPAQWLAETFSKKGRRSWKYQYSVTPAYHGADLSAYFSVGATTPNLDFRTIFQKIWGNFVIKNTPVISLTDATANATNATVPIGRDGNMNWPPFKLDEPWQLDLNTTGGKVELVTVTSNLSYYERTGSGIVNNFRLVDPMAWEGGRGARCDFWRTVSARVPQ
ncbi:putative carboxylesterase [Thozetella sp. PMI_491]|nr:putative carboxylesterase [Thozetella sp. PMI_491]